MQESTNDLENDGAAEMDGSRRRFLKTAGAAGATVLAAGCADTETNRAATTTTTTTTQTETTTTTEEETTTQEDETFYIKESFLDDYILNLVPSTDDDIAREMEENYPFEEVESRLEDSPSERHGEILMEPIGDIIHDYSGITWEEAADFAQAARYIAHQKLERPIDTDEDDWMQIYPTPMVVSGKPIHGIDIHTDAGKTTTLAEYGLTDERKTLYPGEDPNSTVERWIESLTQDETQTGSGDHNLRITSYDEMKTMNQKIPESEVSDKDVDFYHLNMGKLVPGLYPEGLKPENPWAWTSRSGAKELQEEAIHDYDGPDYLKKLHDEFQNTVNKEEIGLIHAENDQLTVEPVPQEEYTTERYWAPEPSQLTN
ncbi:hypothetical protein J2752_000735 [Halarchaeum rubridurum]|uniref:Tat (Twin-arginine translocation) pathway signal sequence n=1 Tax=Halarchaeum rubridurum TaxID=489911 RepID=A0A8T4GPI5_9EURY|nr:twin-arginine translocation signal domain-containing protein [Halarchaeum rubridurum]MBP1953854.1 hypothetical protein [Halarchaeum rubridurum]